MKGKKEFSSFEKPEGKSGLGLLLQSTEKEGKKKKDWSIKSYYLLNDDIDFIERYARYMAFKKNEKYTHQRVLNDALNLLRKKHPEIAQAQGE